MTCTDTERLACVTLSAIVVPGDPFLGAIVRRHGPLAAVEIAHSGRPPGSRTVAGKYDRPLSGREGRWHARSWNVDAEAQLAEWEDLGGRVVCPGEAEWPTQLDDLGDAQPIALWLRGPGDLRFDHPRSVAIIGARAPSSYGVHVAADMTGELAERGYSVVSSGAMGIDAAVHRGALAVGGGCVAVVAGGLSRPHPACNDRLFAELDQRAVLISESPPLTQPTRHRIMRNGRLIAALAGGTAVVEAARYSGALKTADYARDLGRAVMAVPGPVTSLTSAGCHQLMRATPPASCVTSPAEIIEELGRIRRYLAPDPRPERN
jgi:DNA processing protein